MKRLFGFTLAEVLITLGIIGVVAAMTIPTLVANYQKQVWVTQLKKDANFISNSIKKVLADEEVDSLCNASIGGCSSNYINIDVPNINRPYILGEKFGKYFDLSPVEHGTLFYEAMENEIPSAGSDVSDWIKAFYLKDGSCIATATTYSTTGTAGATAALGFFVDVNCDKGPNKWGRDRFLINYDARGNIPGSGFSDEEMNLIKSICYSGDDIMEQAGFLAGFCSLDIIRNGWQMKY